MSQAPRDQGHATVPARSNASMIVTCPACGSRYRLDPNRVSARGARITCPTCAHRFVVQRAETLVSPLDQAQGSQAGRRGVGVTIAKDGKLQRPVALPSSYEDDEEDAPTTLIPENHRMVEEMRRSVVGDTPRGDANDGDALAGLTAAPSEPAAVPQAPAPAPAGDSNLAQLVMLGVVIVGVVFIAMIAFG